MSDPPTIPWYRLHLVTCLVLMVLAVAGALGNLYWHQVVGGGDYGFGVGWPLRYQRDTFGMAALGIVPSALAIAANVIVCTILAIGTAVLIEMLLRRRMTRSQFSLSFLVTLITTVALLLADMFSGTNLALLAQSAGLNPSILFWEIPVWISVPLYLAIVGTLFVAVSLLMRAIAKVYARLFPAQADGSQ